MSREARGIDDEYLEAHKFRDSAESVGLRVLSRADELYRY